MSQKNSVLEMIGLGIVLAIYAMAACTVLAIVNNFTFGRIAQNKLNKANAAMKAVVKDADSFEAVDSFPVASNSSITIQNIFIAKQGENVIGGVAQVTGPTYDKGTIMVGMKSDGTVTGLQFLELTDSPGFGLKANDPTFTLANGKTFYGQFEGKNAKDGFVAGQTFDSISGATITSVGIGNLISAGTECLLKVLDGQEFN
ncbi:MAG: FMN-binding protein [Treponema succinifaciens]|uniref:FMN-binding protein n=1 Tax=Treponema succinifaciens TaxID=167 RepID=UPI002352C32D|nr:FMN-binding protein [Treponema succinifaciens]MCI6912275.1 FMN-binding protein [Treponema succinifaciens]